MTVSIEGKRFALPKPAWSGRTEIGTGITLIAVYVGCKHVILRTYSIWDNGRGASRGTQYRLADAGDLNLIERVCGNALMNKVADVIGVETEEL